MCKLCNIFETVKFKFCANCGADLFNGKIRTNSNIFKLDGYYYEFADETILFNDWFIDLSEIKITMIRHHSYSESIWNRFDKKTLRKIIKTNNPLFVFENIQKFKNEEKF